MAAKKPQLHGTQIIISYIFALNSLLHLVFPDWNICNDLVNNNNNNKHCCWSIRKYSRTSFLTQIPPANAEVTGLIPDFGRSHMLWRNWAMCHNYWACALESTTRNYWSLCALANNKQINEIFLKKEIIISTEGMTRRSLPS